MDPLGYTLLYDYAPTLYKCLLLEYNPFLGPGDSGEIDSTGSLGVAMSSCGFIRV